MTCAEERAFGFGHAGWSTGRVDFTSKGNRHRIRAALLNYFGDEAMEHPSTKAPYEKLTSDSVTSADGRVFGLDALRCLAIVLVVLTHGLPLWPGTWLGSVLSALPDGVEIFFVLSGYLIGDILLRTSLNSGGLVRFWLRRWMRTLPAYFVVLFVSLGLVHLGFLHSNGSLPWWRYATFTHNLMSPFVGFFWESWSLSIEAWFYLVAPLLMLCGHCLGKVRAYFLSALLLILLAWMWRCLLDPGLIDAFGWDQWYRKLVPGRLDAIGWGLIAALVHRRWSSKFYTWRIVSLALGLTIVLGLLRIDRDWNGAFVRIGLLGIQSVGVALILPVFALWHRNVCGASIVRFLSRVSYSLYLVNLGWVAVPLRRILDGAEIHGGPVWFILYLAISLIMAAMLYYAVELPFMRLRDRVLSRD